MTIMLLSASDIKQCITMPEAIQSMEQAFLQLATQQVKMPIRTGIPVAKHQALTLTMPGYLAGQDILGLKVVSIFPNNLNQGKTAINGAILLLDANTGEPAVLMDAAYLTALRTGAISGLATQYFSPENAKKVAIIGSGVQAFTQLEAVSSVRDIEHVWVWSRNANNAEEFAAHFASRFNIQATCDLQNAVADADIICTATGSIEPLIDQQTLLPHVHINAIGSHTKDMRELGEHVLSKSHIIVDQLDASLTEAGELIHAVHTGVINKDSILELGTWLQSKDLSLQHQPTVFKSVGLAIQDLSVAHVVYCNALEKQLGMRFSLNS